MGTITGAGLQTITDNELILETDKLTRQERKISVEVLLHLVEVERRKLHLQLGYRSLFDYCTRRLGYSESAAGRRIRTARCLRNHPEVLRLLKTGRLSICIVSRISGILTEKNEKDLLGRVSGKSLREVDRVVARFRPQTTVRDRITPMALPARTEIGIADSTVPSFSTGRPADRSISDRRIGGQKFTAASIHTARTAKRPAPPGKERFKVSFAADRRVIDKMEKVRTLLSGRYPSGLSVEKLFELLMDEYIEKHDPAQRSARRKKREGKAPARGANAPGVTLNQDGSRKIRPEGASDSEKPGTRHVPAITRDAVFQRDGGRCTFAGPGGTRCGSTWDLEIDHIRPFALGGGHTLKNLRLLCSAHNRLESERIFGKRKRLSRDRSGVEP